MVDVRAVMFCFGELGFQARRVVRGMTA